MSQIKKKKEERNVSGTREVRGWSTTEEILCYTQLMVRFSDWNATLGGGRRLFSCWQIRYLLLLVYSVRLVFFPKSL